MELLDTIGKIWAFNLKRYRGERSQEVIAKAADISRQAYGRMEDGVLPKSPATITAVAKALGCRSESLLFQDPHLSPLSLPSPTSEALLEKIESQQVEIRKLRARTEGIELTPVKAALVREILEAIESDRRSSVAIEAALEAYRSRKAQRQPEQKPKKPPQSSGSSSSTA